MAPHDAVILFLPRGNHKKWRCSGQRENEVAGQQNLREVAMWHRHKERGNLGLAAAEKPIFCGACARHREREPPAREVGMWLSTYRPALAASKARAAEQRKAMRKYSDTAGTTAPDEGYSSAGSGGDGEPAEPAAAGPLADLQNVIDENNP